VNDKSSGKNKKTQPLDVSPEQMEELKRDMRTAKLLAWVQENQQKLLAAGVALLILIVGASLWKEHIDSQRASAATLYHQALDTYDREQKMGMLKTVVDDYNSTAYATLALMLLSGLDEKNAAQYLQQLLSRSDLTPELKWQAKLDIASLSLRHGDAEHATSMLTQAMGKHYEQLRLFLLAEAASSADEKRKLYTRARDAISHDAELKRLIDQRLAESDALIKSAK